MFLEDRFLIRKTVANARIVALLMVRFQCCETLRWHSYGWVPSFWFSFFPPWVVETWPMPTLQPPIPKCPWAHISSFDLLKGLKLQDNTHYLYRPLILKLWDQILMVPMEYLPLGYSRNYIVGCILSQMPYIVVTVNLQTWCRVQVSFHVAVFKRKSEKKKNPVSGKD